MKKLLYTIFTILCLSLIFTNKAWCPSIGGSIIGSQTSFTGLVQVSGQTATFNTIWLNGVPLSNVTGHTVEDEGVSLYPRTLLNFVGAGVTAADDGVDTTTVTIPGGGVGATAWTDIGDSTGDTVIDLAGWLSQFTSTMDAANGYVFDIYDSDADLANDTYLMKLRYLDNGDANGLFLGCFDNQTDAKFIVGLEGSLWTASYLYGICDPLIVHQGNTNTTRYYLWAWNNSTTGTFAMTYWKDITGTLNSYLQYNWNGSLKTAFWGDGSISVSDITGVKISGDSDGAITFKGQGDGADEDITMNLDDTADTIVFTSSTGVNLLNFSAFAISGATFNSGSGAMDLGDAAVANGDTDSLPTCDGVYDFVVGGWVAGAGVFDLGGATSLEVPNSAAPTVDAVGKMGVDTNVITQGMLEVYLASALGYVVATTDTPGDNEVPTYDAAGGTIQWEAGGAGGGAIYREITLLPESCVLDDTVPPAITIIESTGTGTPRFRVADFDATTDEIIYFTFVMPSDYTASSSPVVDIYWYANDTGANEDCIWAVQLSATTPADADAMSECAMDADIATVSDDCDPNEANRLVKSSVTLTYATYMDSAAAGDVITLRISRDADDSIGDADNDGLTSDARLVAVHVKIPRS